MNKTLKALLLGLVLSLAMIFPVALLNAGLTGPGGDGSPTVPGTFCKADGDTWWLCNSSDTLGDVTYPISSGYFTALTVGTMTSGNITMTDDAWIGTGSSAGRIVFDDDTLDKIELTGALVQIGDGTFSWNHTPVAGGIGMEGILEVDGNVFFDAALSVDGIATFGDKIISDAAGTDDIGSAAVFWNDLYLKDTIQFEGSTDNDYNLTLTLVDPTTPSKTQTFADITGTIVTTAGANANVDIGAYDLRGATVTADGLTSTRVIFAGANGLLSDDDDFTFVTDTLTITKIAATEFTGNIAMGTNKITGLGDPTAAQDAATREYVDLAVGFTFDYFLNDSISVGSYYGMTDTDLGGGATDVSTVIGSSGDNKDLDAMFITGSGEPGVTELSAGVYDFHFHAAKTAGGSDVDAIYIELWKYDIGPGETLLGATELSGAVDTIDSFNIHLTLTDPVTILTTDRLLIKFHANIGSGGGATVAIYIEGTYDSRMSFQTTSAILSTLYLRRDGTVAMTGNLDMGAYDIVNAGSLEIEPDGTGNLISLVYANEWTTGVSMIGGFASNTTLSGDISGTFYNFETNVISVNRDINGFYIRTPAEDNTSDGPTVMYGFRVSGGAIDQVSGAGTTTWTGLDITIPAITETAVTVTGYGVNVTMGTATTGGDSYGITISGAASTNFDNHAGLYINMNADGDTAIRVDEGDVIFDKGLSVGDLSSGQVVYAGASGLLTTDVDFTFSGAALTLGSDGTDGQLNLFSEIGATDYTASLFANASMGSNASFYLPADEPGGTYLLNMTSGGIMGFDSSSYLTSVSWAEALGVGNTSGSNDVLIDDGQGMVIGHIAQLQIQGTTPEFQLLGTGNADSTVVVLRTSSNVSSADIIFVKARGTLATPTVITTGDNLGAIRAIGHDSVDLATISSEIVFDSEGTIAEDQIPGVIILRTANSSGILTDALTIDSSQNLITTGTIELGHATATTLSGSGGVLSVEGAVVPTVSSTNTLTNKAITKRVVTTANDATAIIDIDITDVYELTAMSAGTEFTVTGTETDGQMLMIRIKDNGTSRALTWTDFTGIGVTLPANSSIGKWHYIGCTYNLGQTDWHCIAVVEEA